MVLEVGWPAGQVWACCFAGTLAYSRSLLDVPHSLEDPVRQLGVFLVLDPRLRLLGEALGHWLPVAGSV